MMADEASRRNAKAQQLLRMLNNDQQHQHTEQRLAHPAHHATRGQRDRHHHSAAAHASPVVAHQQHPVPRRDDSPGARQPGSFLPTRHSSCEFGSPSAGSPRVGSPRIGSPNVGSPRIGSPNVGSPTHAHAHTHAHVYADAQAHGLGSPKKTCSPHHRVAARQEGRPHRLQQSEPHSRNSSISTEGSGSLPPWHGSSSSEGSSCGDSDSEKEEDAQQEERATRREHSPTSVHKAEALAQENEPRKLERSLSDDEDPKPRHARARPHVAVHTRAHANGHVHEDRHGVHERRLSDEVGGEDRTQHSRTSSGSSGGVDESDSHPTTRLHRNISDDDNDDDGNNEENSLVFIRSPARAPNSAPPNVPAAGAGTAAAAKMSGEPHSSTKLHRNLSDDEDNAAVDANNIAARSRGGRGNARGTRQGKEGMHGGTAEPRHTSSDQAGLTHTSKATDTTRPKPSRPGNVRPASPPLPAHAGSSAAAAGVVTAGAVGSPRVRGTQPTKAAHPHDHALDDRHEGKLERSLSDDEDPNTSSDSGCSSKKGPKAASRPYETDPHRSHRPASSSGRAAVVGDTGSAGGSYKEHRKQTGKPSAAHHAAATSGAAGAAALAPIRVRPAAARLAGSAHDRESSPCSSPAVRKIRQSGHAVAAETASGHAGSPHAGRLARSLSEDEDK